MNSLSCFVCASNFALFLKMSISIHDTYVYFSSPHTFLLLFVFPVSTQLGEGFLNSQSEPTTNMLAFHTITELRSQPNEIISIKHCIISTVLFTLTSPPSLFFFSVIKHIFIGKLFPLLAIHLHSVRSRTMGKQTYCLTRTMLHLAPL